MKAKRSLFGIILIFCGVAIFSGTVPSTKLALNNFNPYQITFMRFLVGGILAFLYLVFNRKTQKLIYYKKTLWKLSITLCSFPLLLGLSLEGLPASFGSIALGLIPLSTSLVAVVLFKDKVQRKFFLFAFLGSMVVVIYSFNTLPSFTYHLLILFFSILIVAIGYNLGTKITKLENGPTSISLANIYALPFCFIFYFFDGVPDFTEVNSNSLYGLIYVAVFSQYFGFFPFYKGLALVGTARGIQVQLLQPFLTLVGSYLILGEVITLIDILVSLIVLISIYFANR